jgi:hypothetical protein
VLQKNCRHLPQTIDFLHEIFSQFYGLCRNISFVYEAKIDGFYKVMSSTNLVKMDPKHLTKRSATFNDAEVQKKVKMCI